MYTLDKSLSNASDSKLASLKLRMMSVAQIQLSLGKSRSFFIDDPSPTPCASNRHRLADISNTFVLSHGFGDTSLAQSACKMNNSESFKIIQIVDKNWVIR
jgi:hypothetical protein